MNKDKMLEKQNYGEIYLFWGWCQSCQTDFPVKEDGDSRDSKPMAVKYCPYCGTTKIEVDNKSHYYG